MQNVLLSPRGLSFCVASVCIGAITGCSSDDTSCGIGNVAQTGMKLIGVGTGGSDVGFGPLDAGANNDCPAPMAPSGVISLTIGGTQTGGAAPITFCVSRPDLLGKSSLAIGTDFQLVDVNADVDGCRLSLDRSTPASGTAKATGLCGNGIDPAGFGLTLDAEVSLSKQCAGGPTQLLRVPLRGTIEIAPQ
jgi:hypothetical protein